MEQLNHRHLTANALKNLAIVAMVIDHIAWMFLDTYSIPAMLLHTIGKLTGPIMFFFLSEGLHYTHDRYKYIMRLVVFTLISHIPYNLFANHGTLSVFPTSVIFTLLCGLLALIVFQKISNKIIKWFLILLLTITTFFSDWSVWGVAIALSFGIYYGNRIKQYWAYFMVNVARIVFRGIIYQWNPYCMVPLIVSPFIVILLLHFYDGTKGGNRYSKWLFYIFYPAHFLILEAIALGMGF